MVRRISLTLPLHEKCLADMEERLLDDSHYDTVISGEDVDVLRPDGSLLLAFRHRHALLPAWACRQAFEPLRAAASSRNDRRGYRRTGVIGFYIHHGEPGPTAFTRRRPRLWRQTLPLLQAMDTVLRMEKPELHARQRRLLLRETDPQWIIPGTTFTTAQVSRMQCAKDRWYAHRDANNLSGGWSVLTALDAGHYEGCLLAFPRWRVACDIRSRDVLIADGAELHGNTPVAGSPGWQRISVAAYCRALPRQ